MVNPVNDNFDLSVQFIKNTLLLLFGRKRPAAPPINPMEFMQLI